MEEYKASNSFLEVRNIFLPLASHTLLVPLIINQFSDPQLSVQYPGAMPSKHFPILGSQLSWSWVCSLQCLAALDSAGQYLSNRSITWTGTWSSRLSLILITFCLT